MIRTRCNDLVKDMARAIDEFPWESEKAYACYMAQTYYYTSHSVRLLALAMGYTSVEQSRLYAYFCGQISEEVNHEKIAVADCKSAGFQVESFKELSSCRMLWEPQYYKVQHVHPDVLLGYILLLEVLAVEKAKDIALRAPSKSKFMTVHGEEDISHIDIGFSVLEYVEDKWHDNIIENMEQTANSYINLLGEIKSYIYD